MISGACRTAQHMEHISNVYGTVTVTKEPAHAVSHMKALMASVRIDPSQSEDDGCLGIAHGIVVHLTCDAHRGTQGGNTEEVV